MTEGPAFHVHRGTRAVQRMVEFAPSTGGLALWVRHLDLPADAAAPAVATDGNTLFYGAAFERRPLEEQAGLVAHEVLHIALRHPQRFLDLQQLLGDVDLRLFNICADALVNSALSHLTWLRLPSPALLLDRLLLTALGVDQSVEKSLLEWDVERLYRAIDDRPPPEGRRSPSRQARQGGRQADEPAASGCGSPHAQAEACESAVRPDGARSERVRSLGAESAPDLLPGPDTRGPPEEEAGQAREWSERILRGHAGDGPHSMLRELIADLPRSRTPWQQVLRSQLARSLSSQRDLSWSRPARSYIANQGRIGPNRRLPWEPGFTATKRVANLVVIIDVSGSIDDALMQGFAREIESIARRTEAALVLIVGDDRVRRVERFEPGRRPELQGIRFAGGGGTDFTQLLEAADGHRPDIAVVLTDLEGPARFRPRWPVLWVVPESARAAMQPFGRKLVLD